MKLSLKKILLKEAPVKIEQFVSKKLNEILRVVDRIDDIDQLKDYLKNELNFLAMSVNPPEDEEESEKPQAQQPQQEGDGQLQRLFQAVKQAPTWHGDRVFISDAYEAFEGNMSLDQFKQWLVSLHRKSATWPGTKHRVRLTRADLVQAMPPEKVQQSEARYMGATFNFIVYPGAN